MLSFLRLLPTQLWPPYNLLYLLILKINKATIKSNLLFNRLRIDH